MARSLTGSAPASARRAHERRTLGVVLLLVLLLHGLALAFLSRLLQPPSLLARMTDPLYTRTITIQVAAAPPQPAPQPTVAAPQRPTARFATARPAPRKRARRRAPEVDASGAGAGQPAAEPGQAAAAPAAADNSAGADASPEAATADAATPAAPASAEPPPFLAQWPPDTRLRYQLSGNYRGELHGKAEVLWQREGTRYQAVVQLDVGLLLSSRFTSQGEITAHGLAPEVYEEQVRQRRRGVRIGADVRLDKGERVARPDGVQDAASQFIELSHRFATGQLQLAPDAAITLWLARPGGVDAWTYDVVGEEPVQLPRLGQVAAWHLKPRPLDKPRGPISAEIWFAPSLQYLPVRIRLTQGADTWMDLTVETVEQQ